MANALPHLRFDLDFYPSADPRRPGLVIEDRNGFSDQSLLVPPLLVEALHSFNGQSTEAELKAALTRLTGDLDVSDLAGHLQDALSGAGFLDDDVFAALRDEKYQAWRDQPEIPFAHSGGPNYPEDPLKLKAQFDSWFHASPTPEARPMLGIAAPHASPGAAQRSYCAAYGALAQSMTREQAAEKTFVILGTSHYGEADLLGTTAKDLLTPLGRARVDLPLLQRVRAGGGPGVLEEDFFFSREHSVEFQVVFLQYLFGPDIKILPLLCGSFGRSIYLGGAPEENDHTRRYLDTLAELAAVEQEKLVWVLGVDMAHIGKRYGDKLPVTAHQGHMLEITERDQRRIHALNGGDRGNFWSQVQENRDDLKWCGSTPFYSFLRVMPHLRGQLLDYEHWQIDPESVVTFGAMRFDRAPTE